MNNEIDNSKKDENLILVNNITKRLTWLEFCFSGFSLITVLAFVCYFISKREIVIPENKTVAESSNTEVVEEKVIPTFKKYINQKDERTVAEFSITLKEKSACSEILGTDRQEVFIHEFTPNGVIVEHSFYGIIHVPYSEIKLLKQR